MKNILSISWVALLSILLAAFLTACGAGGGGGDGEEVNPLTSVIRTYKIGDSITYEMTLKDTASGNEWSGDVIFRIIEEEVTNPYGIKCKAYEIAGTLTGPGGSYPFITKELFYQDDQGNLYDCGKYDKNIGYIFISNTQDTPDGLKLELKNPVSIGDIFSGTTHYDDGSWSDCTTTIVGTEIVDTLMGKYETYKINSNCSLSNGFTFTTVETDWYYPSIYTVKATGILNGYEMTLNMKNYNLIQ